MRKDFDTAIQEIFIVFAIIIIALFLAIISSDDYQPNTTAYAPNTRCTIIPIEPEVSEIEQMVLDGREQQLSTECVLETR